MNNLFTRRYSFVGCLVITVEVEEMLDVSVDVMVMCFPFIHSLLRLFNFSVRTL
jgi:hypothetical protein